MKTFQDNAGRTWTVAINVDAVKRVRDLLKEDLLDVEHVLQRLMVDPILLCDVIYCVCKPQADAENISDVQFAQAMAGDAIAHAKTALVEELVNFSPDPRDRENLGLAVAKFNMMAGRAQELIKARLDSPKLSQEIEAALSAVGVSFTNLPESSESTPDR
ncbi:MAG: hypothetical protein KJZ87_18465 [Thermoguttaceae bacterium]|nr:hypothetical protein [Thermoguttaceae bacterium]